MIVRIQSEGQWELNGAQLDELNAIDDRLVETLGRPEHDGFGELLAQMLGYVRSHGRALRSDELHESELILPPADATADEVKSLFAGEGLIPS